jgi:disulfide bond formation protein DsbB
MAVDKMPRQEEPSSTAKWEPLALAAAILTLVGSLYLSMGMGLVACPLCFYQRTFIMGVVGVLGVGMALRLPLAPGTLSLLALPLAVAGLGVALIHSNLVWTEVLACPLGIFALGSAPFQSLIAYAVVTALLLPGAFHRSASPVPAVPRTVGLVALGLAFTLFSVLSSPKLPPFNPKYDETGKRILKGCEPAKPAPTPPAARS